MGVAKRIKIERGRDTRVPFEIKEKGKKEKRIGFDREYLYHLVKVQAFFYFQP